MARRTYRLETRSGLDGHVVIDDEARVIYIPLATLEPGYAAIPTSDPTDDGVTIWNDGGVLKVSGESQGEG